MTRGLGEMGAGRRRLMAANWKMHKVPSEAGAFTARLLGLLAQQGVAGGGPGPGASGAGEGDRTVEVAICPPFPALAAVARELQAAGARAARAGISVSLGAQNLHWEAQGAYTGEVSGPMLADVGCRYVIVGHSERRHGFGETDEQVARKVRAATAVGLVPIVCVGETLAERRAGQTEAVVTRQLDAVLEGLESEAAARMVFAYEPVWAIGTGENATGEEADRVINRVLRARIAGRLGEPVAESVRILYGGSVNPDNIGEFMAFPDIDGALVGGASLKLESFSAIVAAGRRGP